MYDIAIIGLGPAGSTLARLLSDKYKTVAIDKKGEFSNFSKPCGGLLSPTAQKTLKSLDLKLPENIIDKHQFEFVKTYAFDSNIIKNYPRNYLNINRNDFDMWLESMIPNQVDIIKNSTCTNILRMPYGFLITYFSDGEKKTLKARIVVGADGANSIVKNKLFPEKKIRRYTSIQQWFTLSENSFEHAYSCIFDPCVTDCYAWSLPKEDYFLFGGAFPAENCRERFEMLKSKAEEKYGVQFGTPIKTEACLVLCPSSPFDFFTGDDNAFFIGEAAGFISPSSLEGISGAMRSGKILADVLNGNKKNPHSAYRKATFKLCMKTYLKAFKRPFMFNPFLRKAVMKSGITSVNADK